jgi:hypothetical protein
MPCAPLLVKYTDEPQQNNDGDGNAYKPKENAAHEPFLFNLKVRANNVRAAAKFLCHEGLQALTKTPRLMLSVGASSPRPATERL